MSNLVTLQRISGPCEGTSIFSIHVGAVDKFDRNTRVWSERLCYGPVALRRLPGSSKLIIQVSNRLNIESLRLDIDSETLLYRDGPTLMFRTTQNEIYGLVCKEHDMDALQREIGAFFAASEAQKAVVAPVQPTVEQVHFSRPHEDVVRSMTSPKKSTNLTPRPHRLNSSEKENTAMPLTSPLRSVHIASGNGSPLPAPRAPPLSWNGSSAFVPGSVFRRAAAINMSPGGQGFRGRGRLSNG
uniref:IRS-type PTB domain-containing protein n=1 Tax=Panagrellus redivivus TaxID=6233 RepID=A0A7E5A1M8_PANRE